MLERSTKPEGRRACFRQYFIAFCAHLGALNMALVLSWSSTALPSLRESTDAFGYISKSGEAWIASITFLAGAFGSTVSGKLQQKFGPRKSLIMGCLPLILGWMIIVWAPTFWAILLGRFITGFSVSGVSASVSLMGELAQDSRRGRINIGFHLLFSLGVLVMYVVGTFVGWQAQALACAVSSIIYLVLLITVVKESPHTLLVHGNEAQATKILKHVRDSDDIKVELNEIQGQAEHEKRNAGASSKAAFFCDEVMKPIFICTFLQFFLQTSGVAPIIAYAVDVFRDAGTEGVHENISTIVLGVFNLVATGVASAFVDKQGRRRMFIISEIILFVSLLALGVFLMFRDHFGDHPVWNWFPLLCFVICITGYSFGVGPLPWVLMGEIFSPNAKGYSNGIVTCTGRILGFLIMFFFNNMNVLIGQHGVYLVFAMTCISGAVFVYLFVPETNGKSKADIQKEINGSWFHCRNSSTESQQNSNNKQIPTISNSDVKEPKVYE